MNARHAGVNEAISGLGAGLDPDWGFIHSEQTGSALDGPGLRTVFWLSGCSKRSSCCHDPDTGAPRAGRRVHVEALINEILEYAPLLAAVRGGVTLSGGEPLVQRAFCMNLLRRLHALDIHTALDTNGFLGNGLSDQELRAIDLVILDLRSYQDETHLRVTGQHNHAVLDFARRLHALARPVWVRFVLVPGLTDHADDVSELARFCGGLSNVERVEVMPLQRLSRFKWHGLDLDDALEEAQPPTDEQLQAVRDTFRRLGSICPG
jgi:pyruvate formate lyase activating enzyme